MSLCPSQTSSVRTPRPPPSERRAVPVTLLLSSSSNASVRTSPRSHRRLRKPSHGSRSTHWRKTSSTPTKPPADLTAKGYAVGPSWAMFPAVDPRRSSGSDGRSAEWAFSQHRSATFQIRAPLRSRLEGSNFPDQRHLAFQIRRLRTDTGTLSATEMRLCNNSLHNRQRVNAGKSGMGRMGRAMGRRPLPHRPPTRIRPI